MICYLSDVFELCYLLWCVQSASEARHDVVIILVEMHLSCFFLSNYRAAYLF